MAQLPARIGPFEVLGVLGAGGMGVVYGAIDPITSARVAVKTVSRVDLPLLSGLRREVHALRRLAHPGVVRVLSTGVDDLDQPWYAMELLEGATLGALRDVLWHATGDLASTYDSGLQRTDSATRLIKRHDPAISVVMPLPSATRQPVANGQLARVLAVVRRLLSTLAYVHGEGVVHRDLKPHNVFLRDGDRPVLVDFGLAARTLGAVGREVLEVGHEIVGTPAYMAPEQIRGDLVDSRADLYAIGCVLHELCTSVPPFAGPPVVIMEQHMSIPAEPPSRLVDHCPPELDALVLALLEKRPRDRIGHAEDAIDAIDKLLGGVEPAIGPKPRPHVYRPQLAGRSQSLRELQTAERAALRSRGSCVLVGGESGIGKTYLVMEAARAIRGFQTIAGICAPVGPYHLGGGGQPLHPFGKLLQVIADRCVADGAATTDKLIGAHGKILALHDPIFAKLPGQDAYRDPEPLVGASARDRLIAAVAQSIAALAEIQPLLVVLDDLQWADEVSMRLLTQLADDWFADKRLLIIGTYRVEEITPALTELRSRPYTQDVPLGKLDTATVRALIGDMLAIDAPPEHFVQFLSHHSDGNPFFVAEYLRCAIAEGLLRRGGNKLRLGPGSATGSSPGSSPGSQPGSDSSGALDTLSLPVGMRELVARRLDGLTPVARTLAAAGSVIGRELDFDVLRDAAGVAEDDAMEGVNELIARQVLEQTDTGALRFGHDKLCEIAYERLPAADKRAYHLAVGRAIERRFGATPEAPRLFAKLATHFLAAGETATAIDYLDRAGKRALANAAYGEARELHRKLLELDDARGTPDSGQRARWERRYGEVCLNLGDIAACDTYSASAMARLGRPVPTTKPGRARALLSLLGEQALLRFGVRGVSKRIGRASGGDSPDDRLEVALSAAVLAWRYFFVEDMVGVVTMALRSANEVEAAEPPIPVGAPYAWLGYASGIARLHALARFYFARAYDHARATNDSFGRHFAAVMEVAYRLGFGYWADVERITRQAIAEIDATGDPTNAELHLTGLANAMFFTGRYAESERGFEQILGSARGRRNAQHHAWGLYGRTLSMVAQGRFTDSLPRIDDAQAILAQLGDNASLIICDGLRAMIHARRGDDALAREAAASTRGRLQKSGFGMYATVTGYIGAAEGYLELADRARSDSELLANARAAVADLRRFSRFVPIAGPAALRYRGQLLAIEGHALRARVEFTRAAELARTLGMPYDEACAHWLAARYGRARERTARAAQAVQIFDRLGCAWHLAQVRAL